MDFSPLILSLQVAGVATVLAAAAGMALAALLARSRFVGRNVIDVLVTVPMVLPPTVLGYYLLVAFGRQSVIGRTYEALTGSPIVFTTSGAVLAAMVSSLPIVVKSSRAALESVDAKLVFAARTLGATPFRAFWSVELPLAMRGALSGIMLAFAHALGNFGVTLMVAGDIPGETQTASLAIYDAIQAGRHNDAWGLVLVLTIVATTCLYAVNRLSEVRDG